MKETCWWADGLYATTAGTTLMPGWSAGDTKSPYCFTLRSLGYSFGEATNQSHFGYVSSNFAMDEVQCSGTESSLLECPYVSDHDCWRHEGAGVVCTVPFAPIHSFCGIGNGNCCNLKVVGGVPYQLVGYDFSGAKEVGCRDGCSYRVEGQPDWMTWCFSQGELPSECGSSLTNPTCPTSPGQGTQGPTEPIRPTRPSRPTGPTRPPRPTEATGATRPPRPPTNGTESCGNCVFPFTFANRLHTTCTTISGGAKPWCSTLVDSDGVHVAGGGHWEYCEDQACPGVGPTASCTHPANAVGSCGGFSWLIITFPQRVEYPTATLARQE